MSERLLIITHNIEQSYVDKIKDMAPGWKVIAGKDSSHWIEHLQQAEIIAGWKKEIKASNIDQESNLRWFQSWSAGVDALPLDQLKARNVMVTSANGVHANPISETIFALMLSLTRKIHTYVRNQVTKTWHHADLKLELHGKTIGIVGVGAIGKETAKIAKAFGMKVIGLRRSGAPEQFVDDMYKTDELDQVLPHCDYVVNALPSTKETYQLFTALQFNLMKRSAFFINIGRGDTVVEEDLVKALLEKRIAGAGLDVFDTEPLPESSPLWEMENVIITPHTAGSTEYYDKRVLEDIFIPNLHHYLQGEKPAINLVDYEKGY